MPWIRLGLRKPGSAGTSCTCRPVLRCRQVPCRGLEAIEAVACGIERFAPTVLAHGTLRHGLSKPGHVLDRCHHAHAAAFNPTSKAAPVFSRISSRLTPGASSVSTSRVWTLARHLEHAEVGDHHVHHARAGQRQVAGFSSLGLPPAVCSISTTTCARRPPDPSRRPSP